MQSRKTIMIVLGVLLIIFGAIALSQGGIPHTVNHSWHFAFFNGSFETQEVWEIHPIFSGLAIAGGAVLVFLGAKAK